jgi:uncharacterized surface protein with fasciclin (FAS1) repeats
MNRVAIAATATALLIGAGAALATTSDQPKPDPGAEIMNPMIAGQAMLATRDIADNIANSPEHTAFVHDLKESGVDGLLKGKGPFTVFAPTNAAFAASRAGGSDKSELTRLLDYHIVRGRLDSKTLLKLIGEGGGEAKLKTVEGGTLVAMLNGPTNIALMDAKGQVADITIYDVYQANGVMQVIDKVVRPD